MKYEDSFAYDLTIDSLASPTAYYSPWFDVGFANELTSSEKVVTTNISGETIDITVMRSRLPVAETAILTHTQITTATTTTNEQTGSAVGAGTTVIGHRVRYKVAISGTWSTTKAVITMILYAKRN